MKTLSKFSFSPYLLQFAPIDHFNSTKVHIAFEITCLKWRNMLCSVHLSFSRTSSRVKFDSKFVLQAREYLIIRKYILLLFIGKLRIKSQKFDTKHELHSQKATFHSTPTTKQFQSFKKLLRTFQRTRLLPYMNDLR